MKDEMNELNELLEQMKELLGVQDKCTIDNETKNGAKDIIDNAQNCLIVASERGVGWAGEGTRILATWATLTLELLNKVDKDGDMMKACFEQAYKLKGLSEEEQITSFAKQVLDNTKETLESIKKEKDDIDKKLEEINKQLEELKEDE